MAEVKIPIKTTYDGSGYDKLRRDSERAQREAVRATQIQIREQQRLSALTRKLDRDLAQEQKARKPGLAREIGGQFVAANVLQDVTRGIKDFTVDSLQSAAAAERLGDATENLGQRFGVSGKEITQSIQQASLHTVNQLDAMEMANRAMLLGVVQSEEEFAELARMGIVLGRAMGQDAKKSIDDITTGLGRQSPLILDNLGLVVDTEKAHRRYAEALGISTSELTESQKAEAFKQAVLEQGRKMVDELGDVSLDTAGKVEQITAKWQDFSVEFGKAMLDMGEGSGAINTLADAIDRLSEGAKGWQTAGQSAQVLQRGMEILNQEGDSTLGWLEEIPVLGNQIKGLDFWGSMIFRSEEMGQAMAQAGEEIWGARDATVAATTATEDNTAATEDNTEAQDELLKRLERVRAAQADAVGEMLDIEERATEDSAQAWQDWGQDVSDLNSDTWQRIEKVQEDSAKRQKKIAGDLQKDLTKNTADLGKDLAKLRQDADKRVTRAQEDAAREERNQERMERVEALADERLFQFQLRQLAADGQGIAIQQALEQRQIEQQIEEEKAAEQARIKDEERAEDISRIREDAAEQETELRARAEERRNQLIEQAAEEQALREEQLAEQLAAENESYDERRASLDSYREDKLATIEDSKQEAVEALAEELARSGEMTEEEMGKIAVAAGRIGVQAGTAFAYGLSEGMSTVKRIGELLGEGGGGTAPAGGDSGRSRGTTMERDVPGFATGGSFLVGGAGGIDSQLVSFMATPGERVTVSPPGQQGGINITANGIGADLLAAILQRKVDEALLEYHEEVIVPFSQGM